MNEKKKKLTDRKTPEHIVRSGEVTASIYRRQSTSGYAFLVFELQREWTSVSTNRVFRSANFFDRHEEDVTRVIQEAVTWIRRQTNPVAPKEPPSENGSVGTHEDRFPEGQK